MSEPTGPGGPTPPMQPPTQPPAKPTLAFEDPGLPFFQGLIDTIKLFVTDPVGAFSRMPPRGDIGRPILYAVLLGWAAALVEFIWGIFIQGSIFGMLSRMEGTEGIAPAMFLGVFGGMIGLFLAPIFILIGLFLGSALVHLCLMLVGGANEGFVATLRVLCYSHTARVARIVPFLGGIIDLVWTLVLSVIGIKTAHRTSTGKAIAAVLLPFVLCCGCGLLVIASLVMFFGIASSS